ncbi:hypothetical protein EIP86_009671 [Pleurotus ostreatoroseus]|nr:hypothetical protein EIP86_009671 [Pleurotus ostreatoroseus]
MPGFKKRFKGPASKAKRKRPVESNSDEESPSISESNTKRVRWDGDVPDTGEEGEEENDDDESDENASEKTIMAVSCQFGRVGGAYFDPVTCKIFVLEDSQESAYYELTRMLLEQAEPEVALVSSKAEDGCIDVMRSHMDTSGGLFQIRPHKDFLAMKGLNRVLSLHLLTDLQLGEVDGQGISSSGSETEPRNAYDFMQRRKEVNGDPTTQRWNASIRLANYASVETRIRAVGELDDQGIGGLEIRGIEYLTLQDVMQINSDALYSLQVFDSESHASTHSDKTKEGLSLFGILNNTRTTLGKALMREWLLRPSTSIPVINARHDAVACFMRPENIASSNAMQTHLKGIKNVPKILGTLRTGKAQVADWQGLVKFAFHSVMLRDTLSELSHAGSVEVVQKLTDALEVASFKEVGNAVNETIDWEESANAARSKVAEKISQEVPPDYAPALNVVYFPQLGFLICVPMREEWQNGSQIEVLEGWRFQFSSESQVYFKSPEMDDREIEITQALLEKVLLYDDAMTTACDICAELDCLLSFAQASRAYDYRRPVLSEENVIDIRQGRHPLQEFVVDTFVPNDAFLAGQDVPEDGPTSENEDDNQSDFAVIRKERNSVVICTGANACGKSVYLKQVALIQYIAQVQSAFMIDLNQVSLALRNATARSLILLDEFGKGTISSDGAGLFCGLLTHLLARGASCPKVIAATHFHEVFRDDILRPDILPVTFVHMQVMLTSGKGELLGHSGARSENDVDGDGDIDDDETAGNGIRPGERITYLYRVGRGLGLNSHAAMCAEIFGIPRRIVRRADHLLSMHELGTLLDEEMTAEERVDLEDAEEVCRRFLAWDLEASRGGAKGDVKDALGQVLGRDPVDRDIFDEAAT